MSIGSARRGLLARSPFGAWPAGVRRARMERSPQWRGDHFENPEPLHNDMWLAFRDLFRASRHRIPTAPVPTDAIDARRLASSPPGGVRITWLGHSTLFLEVDGTRLLVDPVWSERASPFPDLGPRRFFPPLLPLSDLAPLHAVLISHDHYDHLDRGAIRAMRSWETTFVTPLGVGAHLEAWGVPPGRIVELDWWERAHVGEVEVVATPARHASGRAGWGRNQTLWAGFAVVGPEHRLYLSGDTGFTPGLAEIGARLGPFDAGMIEAGAYGRAWPDWHLGPEQAVQAARLVRAELLVPVHWGLFNLAFHGWTEPPERVLVAAAAAAQPVAIPRPGQSLAPDDPPSPVRWWPELPWRSAAEDPIVATVPGARGPAEAVS